MNQLYKLGICGALLLGMVAGVQAEGKFKSKMKRKWVKNNTEVNDRSKTTNDDGSITRSADKTLTTKKGTEVAIDLERTSTKNDDGTRSFTTTRTATNEDGKSRVSNIEGTVTPNGNGTRTVDRSNTITRRDGSTQTREGSKVLKNSKLKGKKK
jgi:hypothetical protein